MELLVRPGEGLLDEVLGVAPVAGEAQRGREHLPHIRNCLLLEYVAVVGGLADCAVRGAESHGGSSLAWPGTAGVAFRQRRGWDAPVVGASGFGCTTQ